MSKRDKTPARSKRYPVSRLAPPYNLVDMAREISRADDAIQLRVSAKLDTIAKQIRSLQEQARHIMAQAEQDQALHRANCQFKKRCGENYYLYKRHDNSLYFSMLSPEDWKNTPPHEFMGAYRLENDMSWTKLEND